MDIAKPVKKL